MKKNIYFFLLLASSFTCINAQLHLSGSISGGYHFPKITHDGEPIPRKLYTPALSYCIGLRPYYKLNEKFDIYLDLAFQTFAYEQKYFTGVFQHSGLLSGIGPVYHWKHFSMNLGMQYVYITNKSFPDPDGYANPNFFQVTSAIQHNWNKFATFVRFDHGVTEYNKYELTLVRGKFRRLYTRTISVGVAYKIK
jgi:hypothetical protein